MFTYNLSIFLTSTAFVDTNAKIRHTFFKICRIFEKLSFRVQPYTIGLFFSASHQEHIYIAIEALATHMGYFIKGICIALKPNRFSYYKRKRENKAYL